ncbi:beta-lactamase [Emticicia oligotrophica DSM 17448]|uniref:beta-lactamase n=1 Tax=Emticicia oligotrophica (strain DSM 17448 / CIP 109782 / MTCC 6937 / GPTSA100-15) TaxID=929562 RepID=A0ABN4AJP4_EMTOG|nr:subclass B1 metallo-beta-lactamase [Emticicia oligotrophica]AFK02233.1 beta-lactamase [Emticicia oligotrophica DSM 17448]
MKKLIYVLLTTLITSSIFTCIAQKNKTFKTKEVHKTDALVINQIAANAFQHISFKQTNDFGYVPCNGLVIRNNNEAFVFDTPTNDKSSEELIKWITETLHCKIKGVIPTHFHDDCLGGLKAFHDHQIPSYANQKTIEFAQKNNYIVPKNGFSENLTIKVGKTVISAQYFGEGHTQDNVVGYFPSENIMFGGCLIKEVGASKGYLGDANIAEWSNTVEKVRKNYPNVKVVVPGHGEPGNQKLLDYTIKLFRK